MGHPDGNVPSIPPGFVEHCTWPLQLRRLIAHICDLTVRELPEASEGCRNALRYLRCAAAAGACLGGYNPGDFTTEPGDLNALMNRALDRFDEPIEWREKWHNNRFVCNVPVLPEDLERRV